jgi:hypothetical protein
MPELLASEGFSGLFVIVYVALEMIWMGGSRLRVQDM